MKVTTCLVPLGIFLQICVLLPAQTNDLGGITAEDWQTAPPEQLGFSSDKLAHLGDRIKASLPDTTSVLAIRHGHVAFESYFRGNVNSLRHVFSCTKSVMSMLVGILMHAHKISSTQDLVVKYLPELKNEAPDSMASSVTIWNLLTMSSGLSNDSGMGTMSLDTIKEMLSAPNKKQGQFAYNGTNPNLLSRIITGLTGKPASDLAQERLFGPIGIVKYEWGKKYGLSNGAYALALSTRDMARLGYLYLSNGRWKDNEIVPEEWVAESTRVQLATDAPFQFFKEYGFLWWLTTFAGHPAYFAFGSRGQAVVVVSDLDLVVAITANDDEPMPEKYLTIISDYLIPAIALDN